MNRVGAVVKVVAALAALLPFVGAWKDIKAASPPLIQPHLAHPAVAASIAFGTAFAATGDAASTAIAVLLAAFLYQSLEDAARKREGEKEGPPSTMAMKATQKETKGGADLSFFAFSTDTQMN